MVLLFRPNKKRQYKNSKYGHGGQKKRSKLNTAESAGDISDFKSSVHQRRPGFNKKKVRTDSLKTVSSKICFV